jgi:hypothetical protein
MEITMDVLFEVRAPRNVDGFAFGIATYTAKGELNELASVISGVMLDSKNVETLIMLSVACYCKQRFAGNRGSAMQYLAVIISTMDNLKERPI